MELILTIILAFVVAGLGFIIGTVATNKTEHSLALKVEALTQSLTNAPMVIEVQTEGQPLTVDQMSLDVVTPNFAKIWNHFGKPMDTLPPLKPYAEEMVKWYNPDSEYTKLVIVGYLHGGKVCISWTWEKQLKFTPKFVITKEAVEAVEDYYKDMQDNPLILGKLED